MRITGSQAYSGKRVRVLNRYLFDEKAYPVYGDSPMFRQVLTRHWEFIAQKVRPTMWEAV